MTVLSRGILKQWRFAFVSLMVVSALLWPQRAANSAANACTLEFFNIRWDAELESTVIGWVTATELDVVAFQVERATSPQGSFFAIGDVVPAGGDQLSGATYGPLLDAVTLDPDQTYWYRLVIYTSYGAADYTGPLPLLTQRNYLPMIQR